MWRFVALTQVSPAPMGHCGMTSAARAWIRGLAVAVTATLMGAPLAGSMPGLRGRCLSGCPMHDHQKLHCHHGAPDHSAPSTGCSTAAITPPGCACGHGTPSAPMPRAVLKGPAVTAGAAPVLAVRITAPRLHMRAPDPPESPPPIFCS